MTRNAPIQRSIRIAVHKDIRLARMTCRQLCDKYGLMTNTVRAWMDRAEPQWVTEALRVREPLHVHVMPGITREMLMSGRARPARLREVV